MAKRVKVKLSLVYPYFKLIMHLTNPAFCTFLDHIVCRIVQTPCIRTLTNFKDAITAYKLRVNMLILLFRTQENLATYKNIILSCTHNAKIKLKHIYIICMESSFYPLHLKMVYFCIMIPKMVLVFCYSYKMKKYWYARFFIYDF